MDLPGQGALVPHGEAQTPSPLISCVGSEHFHHHQGNSKEEILMGRTTAAVGKTL